MMEKMKRNPNNFLQSEAQGLKRVREENFVYIEERTYLQVLSSDDCNYTLAKEEFFKANFGFPIWMESPYLSIFNDRYV